MEEENRVRAMGKDLKLLPLWESAHIDEEGNLPPGDIGTDALHKEFVVLAFPANGLGDLARGFLRPVTLAIGTSAHDVVFDAVLA
jgi:hypothetical protein